MSNGVILLIPFSINPFRSNSLPTKSEEFKKFCSIIQNEINCERVNNIIQCKIILKNDKLIENFSVRFDFDDCDIMAETIDLDIKGGHEKDYLTLIKGVLAIYLRVYFKDW